MWRETIVRGSKHVESTMFGVFPTSREQAAAALQSLGEDGGLVADTDRIARIAYTEFRCPWGYCSSKSQGFCAFVAVTTKRFVIHNYHRRLVDVCGARLHQLDIHVAGDDLKCGFPAKRLSPRYAGNIMISIQVERRALLAEALRHLELST